MLDADKGALLCDLAETYGVYDFKSLPLLTLATLATGLHEDSRIRLKMAGLQEIAPSFVLMHIADTITMFISALSDSKGKPTLYSDVMTGKRKENKGGMTIEEFESVRQRFLNG